MLADLVNTDLYPLDKLETKSARSWIADLRQRLESDGCCLLPDFLNPVTLAQMAGQAQALTRFAYRGPKSVSPYFFNYRLCQDMDLPSSHPLKREGKRNLAQVAADLIPADSLLSQLHRSRTMLDFLTAVTEQQIYCNRDPYQSLNISVMDEGGCQQWHFDAGKMVTTLLLQEPEAGGEFEYAPAIRTDTNENFDAVEAVLDGKSDRVRRNRLRAGTLSLFRGHYSLHRVTPVIGKRQRLQAILGYADRPDMYGNRESSVLHYGPRVARIEASKPRYPV